MNEIKLQLDKLQSGEDIEDDREIIDLDPDVRTVRTNNINNNTKPQSVQELKNQLWFS